MSVKISPAALIRILYVTTVICMVAVPIIVIGILVATPITPDTVQAMVRAATVSPDATPLHLWAAIGFSGLGVLVLLWTLNEMRKLFAGYQRGEVLTTSSAHRIERIGWGLLGLAILPFVLLPIQTILLTLANPAGERVLSVGISSDMVGFALAAGLMIIIGWAMRQAADVADENRAFV